MCFDKYSQIVAKTNKKGSFRIGNQLSDYAKELIKMEDREILSGARRDSSCFEFRFELFWIYVYF